MHKLFSITLSLAFGLSIFAQAQLSTETPLLINSQIELEEGSQRLLNLELIDEIRLRINLKGPLFVYSTMALAVHETSGNQLQFIWIQVPERGREIYARGISETFSKTDLLRVEKSMISLIRHNQVMNDHKLAPIMNLTRETTRLLALAEGHASIKKSEKIALYALDAITSPIQLILWSLQSATQAVKGQILSQSIQLRSSDVVVMSHLNLTKIAESARISANSASIKSCRSQLSF